jgi:acyl-phosphate glycerol 3-phosphate acyltransferase
MALAVTVLTVVAAYLVGAIPFGYLVARGRGVDIFAHGSGNIGATNVGRVLGRGYGVLVFVLDFAKGALPTWVAGQLTLPSDSELSLALGRDGLPVLAGLAAFLGHVYPAYLKFRGGKGVATGAGVVTMLLPWPAAGALLVWLAMAFATRYISLASLAAAVTICVLRLTLTADPFSPANRTLTIFCFVAAGLVFFRHRTNIARLLQGTENRLGKRSSSSTMTSSDGPQDPSRLDGPAKTT